MSSKYSHGPSRVSRYTGILACFLLASCGGGGSSSTTAVDPTTTPATGGTATGTTSPAACTQSNFTFPKYDAINPGQTLTQINQIIGCQPSINTVSQSQVSNTWQSGTSAITVNFDAAGTAVQSTAYKTASDLPIPATPTTANCTSGNFNVATFSAVKSGMNLAQASQAMGCQATGNRYSIGNDVIYNWQVGTSLMTVYFDATGSTVKDANFKIASGFPIPATPTTATCTASNFSTANFSAITAEQNLSQVSQSIGCRATLVLVSQTEVNYIWQLGTSNISVYFDANGNAVRSGGDYKVATGLPIPATPTTASCTPANFTVGNFSLITAGMSLAQASQAIGCKATSSSVTLTGVTYFWQLGVTAISVYFDAPGAAVLSGPAFKVATGLPIPTTPTTTACTQSNFTFAKFDSITSGMNLTQASQAIGCQATFSTVTQAEVSYTWQLGSSVITVFFDAAGSSVRPGNSFKVASGLT
jgi:hypothetical protein